MRKRNILTYVSWGCVRLPVYHAPVKVQPRSRQDATTTALLSQPEVKEYDSYQVAYYENGKRRRLRAPTLMLAKSRGKAVAKNWLWKGLNRIISPKPNSGFTFQPKTFCKNTIWQWMKLPACWMESLLNLIPRR
jgi:hypothetical protein